jgi:hypothetical protein
MKNILFCTLVLILFLSACREDKYPLPTQSSESVLVNFSDTLYVRLNPDWTGFNRPGAIIVGNEPLLYVADTDNDRIVMLDIAGRIMGVSQRIKRPVAVTQDKRLQLIVCAEFDTVLSGSTITATFGAVYRLNLPAAGHVIGSAVPRRVFYEPSEPARRYTAAAAMYDNKYYIGRTGPKNDPVMIDRDNAILLFDRDDILISPVTANFSPDGTGLLSIHSVTGLATMPTAKSVEFVFSQVRSAEVEPLIKVQWIKLVSQGQTTNYDSKFYPSTSGDVDILTINKFAEPRGVVVDPSGNFYVVDAVKDSLYRFNSSGVERYSFGGRNDPYGRTFNQPYGVAYFDKTLYIADRGNNRICRYMLSSDMQ